MPDGAHDHPQYGEFADGLAELAETVTAGVAKDDAQDSELADVLRRVAVLEGLEPPGPDPEPDPEPEPEPEPGDMPPFMSRPMRSPVVVNGGTDVVLENFAVRGGSKNSPQGQGIFLNGVKRALIRAVDLEHLVGGINIINCEDVVIEDYRGQNIGDSTIGNGHSNYIQYNTSRGGAVRRCKFRGGRTEDMISTWRSGGKSASEPMIIEDNELEGILVDDDEFARRWNRSSGTGIICSDGAGHPNNGNMEVRRNILVNVGQVALQHIDGPNLWTHDNVVIGEQYSLNNQPFTTWGGSPRGVVENNRHNYVGPDGSPRTGWQHKSASQGGMTFRNNPRDTSLKAADYRVIL